MNVVALVIGGFIGTILRYATGDFIPPLPNGFPLGILIINFLGCFLLGWFFTVTLERWNIRPAIRLGLGTGVIGAFTTFSTFSVQTVDLMQHGHFFVAALYVLLSIIGGILLTFAGGRLAHVQRRGGTA
ncbi:fluoride efflux transporter CrcB [Paenibacillus alginolyticus]|uniref:Fluoride-specific ion channel FluC n=1 Tax=Paenibacillus alginolyticus TaxID=59839 RepID=A0ABT4GDC4_9BACL|nr:fluoride efflux transporter CrcB [Paenibacillus alginolyticus]MCY9694184.1 fluoride efflux transporter CrcB [Paenibacillus alginolyticus]MEC0142734.1 fluoride efflux transporter CrcB [Paenibacillus alginolyticus]